MSQKNLKQKAVQDNYSGISSEIENCSPKEMTSKEQKSTRVRDERIDAVKFWLIVPVIAAHVVMRKEFAGSAICAVLWNWLCTFDIPLFIFISGYFSRKKEKKDFWPSIWKILEPLIIFHIIGLFFYVDNISIKKILTPWFMLWYLLSLIYWRILLQIIPDFEIKETRNVETKENSQVCYKNVVSKKNNINLFYSSLNLICNNIHHSLLSYCH